MQKSAAHKKGDRIRSGHLIVSVRSFSGLWLPIQCLRECLGVRRSPVPFPQQVQHARRHLFVQNGVVEPVKLGDMLAVQR